MNLKLKKWKLLLINMIKILCMEESLEEILFETLKKPIDDLTKLFGKLRNDKKFLKGDHFFKNYVGAPTPFIKLENLTDHLGGAKFMQKLYPKLMEGHIKFIMPRFVV